MKVNKELNMVLRGGRSVLRGQKLQEGTVVYNGFIPALIAMVVIPFFVVLWLGR